ncbi:MAG: hypothetical protein ACRDZZ_07380 [Ilumatobacteraceae bacterium]
MTRRAARTAGRTAALLAGVLVLAVSGCGGDDDSDDADVAADDTSITDDESNDDESSDESGDGDDDAGDAAGGLDVDNCSLLTDEEATALAGEELAAQAGDSPAGCAYSPPGEVVGDVVVRSVRYDGDLETLAAQGFPNADSVIPLDGIGDEAVAVTTPAGDATASILARQGDLVVELQVVFLLIEPDDAAALADAGSFAATALGRLVDAA